MVRPNLINPPAASPTSEGVVGMEICKMHEVRIQGKWFILPVPLSLDMTPQERATNFYTTAAKLETYKRDISAQNRINHLAENCNLIALNDVNLTVLYEDYKNQIFDPTNMRIISFHNQAGEIHPDTDTIADAQILKPTGGVDAPTNAVDRHDPNIKFVTVNCQRVYECCFHHQ